MLARGWCNLHYHRWRRYGDPLLTLKPFMKAGEARLQANGYMELARGKLEHVAIAEKALGRPLPKGVQVHHFNEVRSDNRHENLLICPDQAYHRLIHRRTEALDGCGHADWRRCTYCREWDDPSVMYIVPEGCQAYHRVCRQAYRTALL